MKTIVNLICAATLMSALCAGFVACNEPKESPDPEWPEKVDVPFTEYSLTGESGEEFSARWVNLNYVYDESAILIINSGKELKKYVGGECPLMDFSKKTLVLAYGYHSGVGFGDDVKFQQISNRNYVLSLSGLATATLGFVRWHSAIVVDKLPSNSHIELKTTIKNPPL